MSTLPSKATIHRSEVTDPEAVRAALTDRRDPVRHVLVQREGTALYKGWVPEPEAGEDSGLMSRILRKAFDPGNEEGKSNQPTARSEGIIPHPLDFELLVALRHTNVHHGRSLKAKKNATIGFGFKSPEVERALNPLTPRTSLETLCAVVDDFFDTGNGYIEVVRKGAGGAITGLHHMSSQLTKVFIEDEVAHEWHYQLDGSDSSGFWVVGKERHFARFGDRERVFAWLQEHRPNTVERVEDVSEVIHLSAPNNISKWYGVPDWMSVIPLIEMVQVEQQFNYDFFQNWGSVALLLAFLGDRVDEDDWKKIVEKFQVTISRGRGHKSLILNLPSKDLKIDKQEIGTNMFATEGMLEYDRNLALDIMSGHGTPPLIAGVSPSAAKLFFAKTGEVRDTLRLFQAMEIEPVQRLLAQTLECTLGQEITIADIVKRKQEISGVSQEMVEETISGWTPRQIEDVVTFDMTPQLGGPTEAGGNDGPQPDSETTS